jgi:hypothetical protein
MTARRVFVLEVVPKPDPKASILAPRSAGAHAALGGTYADYLCGRCRNVVVSGVHRDISMVAEVQLIAVCGRCRSNNLVPMIPPQMA